MALFKCKMCGGDLNITADEKIVECEFCGTTQTIPTSKDENLQGLFNRANILRMKSEFDKAEQLYEKIIEKDDAQAEAYWGLILCKYGIEYVEDPQTFKRIPTCHRTSFDSIIADEDYKSALLHADSVQRGIYEAEAKEIDRLQKEILELSQKEEPYDVFICYKETDNDGKRTQDSVIANDIYHQLTQEGLKVFYAAITLENKLGSAYEPYIFAALNSSKVMVVLGTKPEFFNAVWVKNEWSRYLALIKQGQKKMLIPAYKDMDPYDLPEEFSHLQAQDMGKLGFMQDLIRGIKKIVKAEESVSKAVKETVVLSTNTNTAPLLERAFMFLEDGDWSSANKYCEKVLDIEPKCAMAYLGKLMAEYKVHKKEQLKNCTQSFETSANYKKAVHFGDDALKNDLAGYIEHIITRNENARLAGLNRTYDTAVAAMRSATTDEEFKNAAKQFSNVGNYKDARQLEEECYKRAEEACIFERYNLALGALKAAETGDDWEEEWEEVAEKFKSLGKYRDSAALAEKCMENAETARKEAVLAQAKAVMGYGGISDYEHAIRLLKSLAGWKDADERILICQNKIASIKKQRKKIAVIATALIISVILCIILFNEISTYIKFKPLTDAIDNGTINGKVVVDNFPDPQNDTSVLLFFEKKLEKCHKTNDLKLALELIEVMADANIAFKIYKPDGNTKYDPAIAAEYSFLDWMYEGSKKHGKEIPKEWTGNSSDEYIDCTYQVYDVEISFAYNDTHVVFAYVHTSSVGWYKVDTCYSSTYAKVD